MQRRRVLQAAMAAAWPLSACSPVDFERKLGAMPGGWVGGHPQRAHAWRDGHLDRAATGRTRRVHTLVIGAGIAGLTAASRLIRAGIDDIVVLDLEDAPGGNARSHVMGGLACPLGAHYLPVPGGQQMPELMEWLYLIGAIRQVNGAWHGNEQFVCHAPQERVFVPEGAPSLGRTAWPGQWHEGVVAEALWSPAERQQFQRFHEHMARMQAEVGFGLPTPKMPWTAEHQALDQVTFASWLRRQGYTSEALLKYADYVCRDDYGASADQVSAWAGVQYFASRHAASNRGDAGNESGPEPILTWPQGNAWLVDHLVKDLGSRWQPAHVALSVQAARREVTVQSWHAASERKDIWVSRHVVMAVPIFVARRLIRSSIPALDAAAGSMLYAPWLVSNMLVSGPLQDRQGPPMSWDNVCHAWSGVSDMSVPSLGYVNARHQSLSPPAGPLLLTHYWALGGKSPQEAAAHRQALWRDDWRVWARRVVEDLARIHPELPQQLLRIDLMRYGHAMSIPRPGVRAHAGLAALRKPQGLLHFAHSDLSGYSVFEEAFYQGVRVADQILHAEGMGRSRR